MKEGKPEELELPGLPTYIRAALYSSENCEKSNVVYVDIMSLPADSSIACTKQILLLNKWLVVVGDAKTYEILQSL